MAIKIRYENLNGVSLSLTKGHIRVMNIDGISSSTEIHCSEGLSFDGSSYISEHRKTREITLSLMLCRGYENARDILKDLFPTNQEGTLYFTFDDGAVRTISCRVEKVDTCISTENNTAEVTLVCTNPFFTDSVFSTAQICGIINLWEFDDWELPAEESFELSALNQVNSAYIINNGNIKTGCVITLTATQDVKGIKIINNRTKEHLALNWTMIDGNVITIDTRSGRKSIIQSYPATGFTQDITQFIVWGSSFLQVFPGKNRFFVTADSGIEGLSVSVQYSPLYEGV